MNPHELLEANENAEWRHRLRQLRDAPVPDLKRGRARVIAAARGQFAAKSAPRPQSFAMALSVGMLVVLMMVVMSGTFTTLPITRVAWTRTNTSDVPEALPGNALTPDPEVTDGLSSAPRTPVPFIVPEPPRASTLSATQTLLP